MGKIYTKTFQLDNLKNETIDNPIFFNISGDGLQIGKNVENVTFMNAVFLNCTGNSVYLRKSGSSRNVKFINPVINGAGKNGILSGENHLGLEIFGGMINKVGLDPVNTEIAPHHGIYLQCPGAKISEVTISNIMSQNGNGITMRSHGQVLNNIIKNVTKYGISYYSDHLGSGENLIIKGNKTFVNNPRGINVLGTNDIQNYVNNIIIEGNEIFNPVRSSIGVSDNLIDITTLVENYGNHKLIA